MSGTKDEEDGGELFRMFFFPYDSNNPTSGTLHMIDEELAKELQQAMYILKKADEFLENEKKKGRKRARIAPAPRYELSKKELSEIRFYNYLLHKNRIDFDIEIDELLKDINLGDVF